MLPLSLVSYYRLRCLHLLPSQISSRPDLFPVKTPVDYGFPCLIAGTILLCCGMLGCAYIIEAATIEDYFVNDGKSPVWLLQMGGQKVGDQVFRPFAARHVSNVYIRSMQKERGSARRDSALDSCRDYNSRVRSAVCCSEGSSSFCDALSTWKHSGHVDHSCEPPLVKTEAIYV